MESHQRTRATSAAEAAKLLGKLFVGEEIAGSIKSYQPDRSDIVISPFSKCGTTWLQQTLHTLRTGGDTDFDDISRVVPWIEMGHALDIDLNARQRANPRLYKSHLPYHQAPKGARYVVTLREPKDAFVSLFKFMEGWFVEPGAVTIEAFAQARLRHADAPTGYWGHLLSWWAQRNNPQVLLLSYAHMLAAPELHIHKLAEFAGISLSQELLQLTLERSSLAYMLQHKHQFDDAMCRAKSEQRCNLPSNSETAKVRKGGVGTYSELLSAELAAQIDAIWQAQITPHTGHVDYAALDAELRTRNAV